MQLCECVRACVGLLFTVLLVYILPCAAAGVIKNYNGKNTR